MTERCCIVFGFPRPTLSIAISNLLLQVLRVAPVVPRGDQDTDDDFNDERMANLAAVMAQLGMTNQVRFCCGHCWRWDAVARSDIRINESGLAHHLICSS